MKRYTIGYFNAIFSFIPIIAFLSRLLFSVSTNYSSSFILIKLWHLSMVSACKTALEMSMLVIKLFVICFFFFDYPPYSAAMPLPPVIVLDSLVAITLVSDFYSNSSECSTIVKMIVWTFITRWRMWYYSFL